MANDPATAPRIDQPGAPELFADDASGALWHNGNLRITLESLRANHAVQPAALSRIVIGTVVMPMASAEALARLILVACDNARKAASNVPQTTPTPTLQ